MIENDSEIRDTVIFSYTFFYWNEILSKFGAIKQYIKKLCIYE